MSKRKGSDTVRDELAALLKVARLNSGMSGQALADTLQWSQSKVTKIENGRTRPSTRDAWQWLEVCQAPEETQRYGQELAAALWVDSRHWHSVHSQGLATRQREVGGLEGRCEAVLSFQPDLIPGLLQTAEYARQVLTLADITGQRDVPEAVAARMQRQATLYEPGKKFDFVLTESALRWHPHSTNVLAAQYDRLLSVSTLENVTLRILPMSVPFGALQSHGFLLFEVPDEPTVIVETFTRELAISDSEEVEQYRRVHATLAEHALSEEDSRAFVRELADSL